MSGKDCQNRDVVSDLWMDESDSAVTTSSYRRFQMRGAAAEKALSLTVQLII